MDDILWRSIRNYEGYYEVSNTGLIRSHITRIVKCNNYGGTTVLHGKIIKTNIGKDNRDRIFLSKNGVTKCYLLSRIVAETWLDEYDSKLTVNHINGNKRDNRVENLECISRADNIRHGYNTGLYRNKQIYITLTNTSTGEVLKFHSLSEASRFFGKCVGYFSNIIKKRERRELRLAGGNRHGTA